MADQGEQGAGSGTPPGDSANIAALREEVARLSSALEEARREAGAAQATGDELRGLLDASARQARDAAARYREALLRAEPSLLPDMLAGDTVDEIDAALDFARGIAGRIEAEARRLAAGATPAGSPERGAPDLAGLSPEQKIRIGLERRA